MARHHLGMQIVIPLALFVGALALYLLFPFIGDRQWDALMTASVLARPEAVSAREVLFFAHPLVIPVTIPFSWFIEDPLWAVAAREIFFAAVVVVLAYLGTLALTGSRLTAGFAAIVLVLATGRWRLATGGEEKEVALAFAGAFVMFFCDHRGHLDLGLGRMRPVEASLRRALLGLLLAIAMAVHLVNGVLVGIVIADVVLDSDRRRAAREAAIILGIAAAAAGPFFVWLALGPGGAQSATEVGDFFFEYHRTGEFTSVPDGILAGLVDAYMGGRTWLVGPNAGDASVVETAAAMAVATVLGLRAYRVAPQMVARLLCWLGLLSAHFLFFQPWDPEAWAPAGLAWAIIGAVGLLAPGAAQRVRIALAGIAVAGLLGFHINAQYQARRNAQPAARFAAGRTPSLAPLADVARWLDRDLEPNALIVVSERLLASYFHIYTRRTPVVRDYLDMTRQELRRDAWLTTLSLAFYQPTLESAQIREQAAAGRPVYLLTDEITNAVVNQATDEHPDQTTNADRLALTEERALHYQHLRVGRWTP